MKNQTKKKLLTAMLALCMVIGIVASPDCMVKLKAEENATANTQAYSSAAAAYKEQENAFWSAVDDYRGNVPKGIEGALNAYYNALDQNAENAEALHTAALEARAMVGTVYEELEQKYQTAVSAYDSLTDEEKASVSDHTALVDGFSDCTSCNNDLIEINVIMHQYTNAKNQYWNVAKEEFTEALERYQEMLSQYSAAEGGDKASLYAAAVNALDAVESAYAVLEESYAAVEAAYDVLTDDDRDDRIVSQHQYLREDYGETETGYHNLEKLKAEENATANTQAYSSAAAAYKEQENAFWSAVDDYRGNVPKGIEGALNAYYNALDQNAENAEALHTAALEARAMVGTVYEELEQKYQTAVSAYDSLTDEEKASVSDHTALVDGFSDCTSCNNDLIEINVIMHQYTNAKNQYWNVAKEGFTEALERYQEMLSQYSAAEGGDKASLYAAAVNALDAVESAYAVLEESYAAVEAAYDVLTDDDRDGRIVSQHQYLREDYGETETGYHNLEKPQLSGLTGGMTVEDSESPVSAELNESRDNILDKISLSEEEIETILGDEQTRIDVVMTVGNVEPTDTHRELIQEKQGDYSVGQYLDISFSLEVGSTSRAITEMKQAVSMTITIPDSLINTDSAKNRIYRIIRIHDGVASVLDGIYENGKFTFESDKFSVYVLIYKDEAASGNNADNNSENDNDEDTVSNGEVSPEAVVDWEAVSGSIDSAILTGKNQNVCVYTGAGFQIPETVLNKLAGKKAALILQTGNGISFSVTGADLSGRTSSFRITLDPSADISGQTAQSVLAGSLFSRSFAMAEKGVYPVKVDVHVSIGKEYAGKNAFLYYYDETAGTMRLAGRFKITEEGQAMFALYRGDEYTVVVADKAITASGYTVVKGDTLSRIAARNGVSLKYLIQTNPWIKDPNRIYPGQVVNF